MNTRKKMLDIVVGSKPLKDMLRYRILTELKLSYPQIVQNAKEDGIVGINKANLSKYFRHDKPISGAISQRSVLYLAVRYGIETGLKGSFIDYNEQKLKDKVKIIFNG